MKSIMKLSFPIMINRSSGQFAIIAIVAIIGNISVSELAYFSLMIAAISVVFGFVSLICVGVQNYAAKYHGMSDIIALKTLFRSGCITSILVGVIGFLIVNLDFNLFLLIGENNDLAKKSNELFKLLSIAIPIVSLISFLSLYLEGVGFAAFTAKVKLLEILVQLSLTALLLVDIIPSVYSASEWVVLSLIAADIFALIVYVLFFTVFKGKKYLSFIFAKQDLKFLIELVRFGLPIALGLSFQKLAYASISFIVASLGEIHLSAYTIIMNIIFFLQIPIQGIAHSNSILASRAIGERSYQKTAENLLSTWKLAIFINVLCTVGFFLLIDIILNLFTNDSSVKNLVIYSAAGVIVLIIGQSTTSIIIAYLRALR